MALYEYRALNAAGRRETGLLTAQDVGELRFVLREAGLSLLRWRTMSPLRRALVPRPGVSSRELAQFFAALSQIVGARTPLLASLRALAAGIGNRTLREVAQDLASQLSLGRSLSLAMGQHRKVFSGVLVALVDAGERAGRLDVAFRQCQSHAEWLDHTGRRVAQSLAYPLFLAGLSVAVLSFLVTWLAPRVLEFLQLTGQTPGVMTLALMRVSGYAQLHWLEALSAIAGSVGLVLALRGLLQPFGLWLDAAVLRVPLLGSLLLLSESSRFSHFMAVGLGSGLPAQRCIDMASAVVGNRALRQRLAWARQSLAHGVALSEALGRTGLFRPLMLESVRHGQISDALPEAFGSASRMAEQDAQTLSERLIGATPKVMIVLVGAVLAWILAALFLPIYSTLSLESLYQ